MHGEDAPRGAPSRAQTVSDDLPVSPQTIRIGTRGSALARTQAGAIADALRGAGHAVEIRVVQTAADRAPEMPVDRFTAPGVFVKELDDALLAGEIDLAVHSLKDVPTALVPGLVLAAMPRREDPRDALVSRSGVRLDSLPPGARVGTGSLRRSAQLRLVRPDLAFVSLRGNVDTRIRKVRDGEVDAAVLALAALRRIGREADAAELFAPERCLPAPAQGILAVAARADDDRAQAAVRFLDDPATRAQADAERALLAGLDGGCRVPIGALAAIEGARLTLRAILLSADGTQCVVRTGTGDSSDPRAVGAALAAEMLAAGGAEIVAALRAAGFA